MRGGSHGHPHRRSCVTCAPICSFSDHSCCNREQSCSMPTYRKKQGQQVRTTVRQRPNHQNSLTMGFSFLRAVSLSWFSMLNRLWAKGSFPGPLPARVHRTTTRLTATRDYPRLLGANTRNRAQILWYQHRSSIYLV